MNPKQSESVPPEDVGGSNAVPLALAGRREAFAFPGREHVRARPDHRRGRGVQAPEGLRNALHYRRLRVRDIRDARGGLQRARTCPHLARVALLSRLDGEFLGAGRRALETHRPREEVDAVHDGRHAWPGPAQEERAAERAAGHHG